MGKSRFVFACKHMHIHFSCPTISRSGCGVWWFSKTFGVKIPARAFRYDMAPYASWHDLDSMPSKCKYGSPLSKQRMEAKNISARDNSTNTLIRVDCCFFLIVASFQKGKKGVYSMRLHLQLLLQTARAETVYTIFNKINDEVKKLGTFIDNTIA